MKTYHEHQGDPYGDEKRDPAFDYAYTPSEMNPSSGFFPGNAPLTREEREQEHREWKRRNPSFR